MSDILAAELHKLLTGRPARYMAGVMVLFTLLMLGLAGYFVARWDALAPEARTHASLASLPQLFGWIASLCTAVFGALAATTEHGSGLIATTYLAMPSRPRVIAAKAILVAVMSFLVSAAAVAVTLVGGALILAGRPIVGQEPVGPASVVLIAAIALSTTAFAMIGLGLGAISRSAVATVVGLMLVWYIVPLVAAQAPEPWSDWLMSALPGALAGEIAGNGNVNSVFRDALSPAAALAALVAYATVPVAAAMAAVRARDV